ncbi:Type-A lantibiotic [Amycolatopsis xylanica]|uniref:Type-A lantibiotic n=1 Tax=Amycolatopsis xylanica TaxID=589385 RepID=A0A1H3PL14_9PSEU|nr:type A2 lanthipeptide [Amycolatopsis xylanica]SDZ01673.1 Type-A lantibiotic [Amycolatopsis xylanica]
MSEQEIKNEAAETPEEVTIEELDQLAGGGGETI